MTTKEIEDRIIEVLQAELAYDLVTLDKTLTQLGADSLDYMDIILALEDEFGIEIDSDKYEERVDPEKTTVEQIAGYLAELMEVKE